ncbi:MAG: IS5 family transposase, partial [Myxococcota bacterium]
MTRVELLFQRLVVAARSLSRRGPAGDLDRFLGGVLWLLHTGAPWRDLPQRFGSWNAVFRRFLRWALSGRWERVLSQVRREVDGADVLMLDSTVVHAHPDAAGAHRGEADSEALGRSRGGFTTKVHAVVSASGRGLTFALTPGQHGDVTQAIPLLGSVPTPLAVLGDRADDADALLAWWSVHDVAAVIPARRNRRVPRPLDRSMYAMRNVIERFFGRWKRWRRVGTRSDKTAAS